MKAIQTKYIGATNTKSSRIKAFDLDGNQVTIGYPHDLDTDAAHKMAAECLCVKMEWDKLRDFKGLIGGGLKNGMVFVFRD